MSGCASTLVDLQRRLADRAKWIVPCRWINSRSIVDGAFDQVLRDHPDLRDAYKSFNSTQERKVDIYFLDKIPNKPTAKNKLINVIEKCNNLSVLGLDKLTWSHIKSIIRNNDCICKFIDIADVCICQDC